MKLKNMLLVLILLVLIPEVLLIAYIMSRYSVTIPMPNINTDNFMSFLLWNPLFLVIVVLVFIVLAILYFTMQKR